MKIYIRLLSILILFSVGLIVLMLEGINSVSVFFLTVSASAYIFTYMVNMYYNIFSDMTNRLISFLFYKKYIPGIVSAIYILMYMFFKRNAINFEEIYTIYFFITIILGFISQGLIFVIESKLSYKKRKNEIK